MNILHSRAAVTRGQLKHSWLENQILNKTPDAIVALHKSGWRALVAEFPERVRQARGLADEVEAGFSPAQLVDKLESFRHLSERQRSSLSTAIHSAYLERFDAKTVGANLLKATESFGDALGHLLAEWNESPTAVAESKLREAARQVLAQAAVLFDALKQLPPAIVLP